MLTAQVPKMWCSLTQPTVNSNNNNFLNKLRYYLAEKRGELKKIWSYHGIGHCREFLKLTVFHYSMRVKWLLRYRGDKFLHNLWYCLAGARGELQDNLNLSWYWPLYRVSEAGVTSINPSLFTLTGGQHSKHNSVLEALYSG